MTTKKTSCEPDLHRSMANDIRLQFKAALRKMVLHEFGLRDSWGIEANYCGGMSNLCRTCDDLEHCLRKVLWDWFEQVFLPQWDRTGAREKLQAAWQDQILENFLLNRDFNNFLVSSRERFPARLVSAAWLDIAERVAKSDARAHAQEILSVLREREVK